MLQEAMRQINKQSIDSIEATTKSDKSQAAHTYLGISSICPSDCIQYDTL